MATLMHFRTAVINDPTDTERRLADFGLVLSQMLAIRDAARAASDDASPLMPLNAPGTLAYIYGVAALRDQLLDKDWTIDRTLGVEAVINHEFGIRIAYQNVDQACDLDFKPMPRSAKGPGSEKVCGPTLFDYYGMTLDEDKDRLPADDVADPFHDRVRTFFVMVGEDGSVELSSPIVANKRYSGFRERIFLDLPGEEWDAKIEPGSNPLDDFDVQVSFKDPR